MFILYSQHPLIGLIVYPGKNLRVANGSGRSIELGRIIEERKAEKADAVEVSLDEL